MTVTIETEIDSRIQKLAEHPPGGDEYARSFYSVVEADFRSGGPISSLVCEIQAQRVIPPSHLANLLLRAFQFQMLKKYSWGDELNLKAPLVDYPSEFDEKRWRDEIDEILDDPKRKRETVKILKERNTNTTIGQRYAGVQIVTGMLFPDREINILDVGCGRPEGLPRIVYNIPFKKIGGLDQRMTTAINTRVQVNDAVAIDVFDFSNRDNLAWAYACGFYPYELTRGLPETLEMEDQINKLGGIRFIQTDFRELAVNGNRNRILKPQEKFEVISVLTALYQDPNSQHAMVKLASKILNPDGGILIVQDFVRKNGGELEFSENWHQSRGTYRTMVRIEDEWLEVLKWESARCLNLEAGEDYQKFGDIVNQRGGEKS